jgi:preprotein translocase YajC subunit
MPDSLLPVLLIAVFAVMLFVQSRNRKKQAATMAAALEPGCEVVLTAGIFATVEAIADDRLIVTTAGSTKLEIARGAVVRVTKSAKDNKGVAPKPAAKKPVASSTAAKRIAKSAPAKVAKK